MGVVLASYAFHAKVRLGAPFFLAAGTITHDLVRVRNATAFSMEQRPSCVMKRRRLIGFSEPVIKLIFIMEWLMEIVVVEPCYEGGNVLADCVLLNRELAQITLPPRLSSLVEILDQSD